MLRIYLKKKHDRQVRCPGLCLVASKLRYRFMSYIASVSEKWLRKPFDYESLSGFFIGWLFLLPALFLFLLATTILLLPFFTLLFLRLVFFIFTAVFGITTSN